MNQKERIKKYLEDGNVLTRLDSWSKLGILEAPARLTELRQDGVPIKTKMVSITNRYGEKVRIAEWSL